MSPRRLQLERDEPPADQEADHHHDPVAGDLEAAEHEIVNGIDVHAVASGGSEDGGGPGREGCRAARGPAPLRSPRARRTARRRAIIAALSVLSRWRRRHRDARPAPAARAAARRRARLQATPPPITTVAVAELRPPRVRRLLHQHSSAASWKPRARSARSRVEVGALLHRAQHRGLEAAEGEGVLLRARSVRASSSIGPGNANRPAVPSRASRSICGAARVARGRAACRPCRTPRRRRRRASAQQAVLAPRRHVEQQRVAAAHQQRHERRRERRVLERRREQVALEMVHADERQARGARRASSRTSRPPAARPPAPGRRSPRSPSMSSSVDAGLRERRSTTGAIVVQVRPAGQLGHDAAEDRGARPATG